MERTYIAGSFDGWDPKANRMLQKDGVFRIKLDLTPGEYQHKFVVDGDWHSDPAAGARALNEYGGVNSVVRV